MSADGIAHAPLLSPSVHDGGDDAGNGGPAQDAVRVAGDDEAVLPDGGASESSLSAAGATVPSLPAASARATTAPLDAAAATSPDGGVASVRLDSRLLRHRPIKVAVLGSGAFGTALGTHLARQGHEVFILTRTPAIATRIKAEHRNPGVFDGYALPYNLTATTEAAVALAGADWVLHAIPVQVSFDYLASLRDVIPADVPIINTSKGLHTERLQLMSDLIPAALGRPQPLVVLSGPTFAEEVMRGYPTGAVAASTDPALAAACARLFSSHTFRVFTSRDGASPLARQSTYTAACGACPLHTYHANATALPCRYVTNSPCSRGRGARGRAKERVSARAAGSETAEVVHEGRTCDAQV